MPRILGVDLPKEKKIEISLTYVFGIGLSLSQEILKIVKIDGNKKTAELKTEEIQKLRELIEKANGLREDAFLNRATLYRTKTDFSLEIMGVDIVGIVDSRLPDIALQKEDVLHIPSIFDLKEEFYVKITGEVNKPGTYLYGEQMTIRDLVLKAGGFKESATGSKMEIARRVKNIS